MTLEGHSGCINYCAFSPDNKQIISASSDETIKIWNLESGIESLNHTAHSGPINSCSFSPDGEMVVSSGDFDRTIKIWSTKTGEVLTSMTGNKLGRITSCAFSPDGKRIASAQGKILQLWDVVSGRKSITLRGDKGVIMTSCAFSRDGAKLVSGCLYGSIIIWDLIKGIKLMSIAKFNDCILKMCAFSPDGKYIVSEIHPYNGNEAINIWNTDTGNRVMIKSHRSSIFFLKEIFPDDEYFATGKQKTLEIIDFEKTNEILPLYEDKYAYTNFCFISTSTEDEKFLSNCLKISETDTAKEIINFYTEGFCNSFSVSPDGNIIACGDNIGNFYLLKLVGFGIGEPIDRDVKLFELVENYKSKILQGGWKSLAHKEHLWNEEYEEERYVVQMSNGEWKELEDLKPF